MKQASLLFILLLLATCLAAITPIPSPVLGSRFLHTEMMEFQPDYYKLWFVLDYTGATTWQVDTCDVDTGEWMNEQNMTITYENGHPVLIENHEGTLTFRYAFAYRESPNDDTIASTTTSFWEQEAWLDVTRETYTYTADNQLAGSTTEYYIEGTWIPVGRGTATFVDGRYSNILIEEYEFGGGWVNDENIDFVWNGDVLAETFEQDWVDEAWQNLWHVLYTFNADENMTLYYSYYWDGVQWMDDFRRTLTYSGDLPVYELSELYMEGNWVADVQADYSYDGQNRIISRVEQYWTDDAWQNHERELWSYSTAVDDPADPAPRLALSAYPNPFNPSATVAFSLAQPGSAELTVYNVRGQVVRSLVNGQLSAGDHTAVWNGCDDTGRAVAGGVYFAVLRAGGAVNTTRLVLLK